MSRRPPTWRRRAITTALRRGRRLCCGGDSRARRRARRALVDGEPCAGVRCHEHPLPAPRGRRSRDGRRHRRRRAANGMLRSPSRPPPARAPRRARSARGCRGTRRRRADRRTRSRAGRGRAALETATDAERAPRHAWPRSATDSCDAGSGGLAERDRLVARTRSDPRASALRPLREARRRRRRTRRSQARGGFESVAGAHRRRRLSVAHARSVAGRRARARLIAARPHWRPRTAADRDARIAASDFDDEPRMRPRRSATPPPSRRSIGGSATTRELCAPSATAARTRTRTRRRAGRASSTSRPLPPALRRRRDAVARRGRRVRRPRPDRDAAAELDARAEAAQRPRAIAELAEEAAVIDRLANTVAGRAPNTLA